MLSYTKRMWAIILMILVMSIPMDAYSKPSPVPQVSRPTLHIGLDYLLSQDIGSPGLNDTEINNIGFRIGAYYRMATVDVGFLVGHYGFGTFFNEADSKRRKSIAQSFATGGLRWRYSNSNWGSYFLGLRIGFSAFLFSNAALEDIEFNEMESHPPATGFGFQVGLDIGVLFHMSKHIMSSLKLGFTMANMPFEVAPGQNTEQRDMAILTFFISYGIDFVM